MQTIKKRKRSATVRPCLPNLHRPVLPSFRIGCALKDWQAGVKSNVEGPEGLGSKYGLSEYHEVD